MRDALATLLNVMDREAETQDYLLRLASEQRDALVNRRSDDLPGIATRQARAAREAEQLAEQAREALDILARHAGLPDGPHTRISAVLPSLTPEEARPLVTRRDALLDRVERLRSLNRINAELFENAMESIRFTFSILSTCLHPAPPSYVHARGPRATASVLVDQHA